MLCCAPNAAPREDERPSVFAQSERRVDPQAAVRPRAQLANRARRLTHCRPQLMESVLRMSTRFSAGGWRRYILRCFPREVS